MTLREVLGWTPPLTHRQYLTLQAWRQDELNRPSRADYYAMRVAQAMAGGRLDDYRVEFQEPVQEANLPVRELTEEQRIEASKRRWLGRRYNELVKGEKKGG